MPENALQFLAIEKSFFGVKVLADVSFAVRSGTALGLVGENGAGKSTLMNILGGNLAPDAGQMMLFGEPFAPGSPRQAEGRGVAFIHQELNLFPNLTIAENIFIGGFPRVAPWLPFIRRRSIRERTRELLGEVELDSKPDTLVEALSAGERQLVEIAKALNLDARIIIFDEPTTSLAARETERLFAIIRRLRERGISMIYISHNLAHVKDLCDDVAVLRDGELVAHGPGADFTIDQIVARMVGRTIETLFPKRETAVAPEIVFEAKDISQPGVVRRISFQLHGGEVLGVAGLLGSGRSELARILFGLDPHAEGEIRLAGEPVTRFTPRQRVDRGLAFLTEDRRAEGLCIEAAIADNIALVKLPQRTRTPFRIVQNGEVANDIRAMREAVRISPTARDAQPVKTLSGGNQQKVVLAKWLLNEPKILILDEPTRGIDVGARFEVYHLINRLAARGAGILMISSEIEELIGMCDRILVMNKGEIRDMIEPHQFDRERILKAALEGAEPRSLHPPHL